MAKITIYPKVNKALIESDFSLATVEMLAKYRPDALRLFDEDKAPYFGVCLAKGSGNISTYGVGFGVSEDKAKLASVEIDIPEDVGDPIAYVEEVVGTAIINLNKVEEQFNSAVVAVAAEKAAVRENITTVE